ncbi:TPA: hypothetical protein KD131_001300 [Vibrio parahaemolyticus]|nr:hypothetical protein [Vibrio parahaemolyticus]ELA9724157.1 hypothetical protein [Vibrio parahaemolyticus]HBC3609357.1 hypothetical protein [Vibrio parahaemolyticus]
MTTNRKETEEQPITSDIDIIFIILLAVFVCISLMLSQVSDKQAKARCRGYEAQIEKSLERNLANKEQLNSIQTQFNQYKKDCSVHS